MFNWLDRLVTLLVENAFFAERGFRIGLEHTLFHIRYDKDNNTAGGHDICYIIHQELLSAGKDQESAVSLFGAWRKLYGISAGYSDAFLLMFFGAAFL